MNIIRELIEFIKLRKKYWLAPVIFTILLVGSLLISLEGHVLAPFIYTLF